MIVGQHILIDGQRAEVMRVIGVWKRGKAEGLIVTAYLFESERILRHVLVETGLSYSIQQKVEKAA